VDRCVCLGKIVLCVFHAALAVMPARRVRLRASPENRQSSIVDRLSSDMGVDGQRSSASSHRRRCCHLALPVQGQGVLTGWPEIHSADAPAADQTASNLNSEPSRKTGNSAASPIGETPPME